MVAQASPLGALPISVGAARIRTSAPQTVPNGSVNTAVQLGAVEFVDRSVYAVDEPSAGAVGSPTYAITLRKQGIFLVSWDVSWASNAGLATVLPLINGATLELPAKLLLDVSATDAPVHGTSMIIKGTVGQTIGLRAVRSGGAANVQLHAALSVVQLDSGMFHCAKIRALSGQVINAFTNAVLLMHGEELISGTTVKPSTATSSITVTEDGAYAIVAQADLTPAGAGLTALEVLIDDVVLLAPEQIVWVNGANAQCLGIVAVQALTAGQTVKLRGTATGSDVTMTPSLAVIRLPLDCVKVTATVDQSINTVSSATLNMPTTVLSQGSSVVPVTNGLRVTKAGRYLLVHNARVGAGNAGLVVVDLLVDDVGLNALVPSGIFTLLRWETGSNDAVYSKSTLVVLPAGAVLKLRGTNGTSGTAFFAASLTAIRLPDDL